MYADRKTIVENLMKIRNKTDDNLSAKVAETQFNA